MSSNVPLNRRRAVWCQINRRQCRRRLPAMNLAVIHAGPVLKLAGRKILEAGVCAPSGGNMQRWRFLVIRDPKVKETVGAYYKRAWDEQVAPRYRAAEPAPGMSRERFLRLVDAAELAAHIHEAPVWIVLFRRRRSDSHVGLVNLPSGSEYAAGGTSARPRRDIDDALLAIREGGGGRAWFTALRPLICPATDRLSDGPVRTRPPNSADQCRL
jgi:nitroreductase